MSYGDARLQVTIIAPKGGAASLRLSSQAVPAFKKTGICASSEAIATIENDIAFCAHPEYKYLISLIYRGEHIVQG